MGGNDKTPVDTEPVLVHPSDGPVVDDWVLASAARLRAVADLELLDSDDEEAFDRWTRRATQLTGAGTALVSLVDSTRSFFKSFRLSDGSAGEGRVVPISMSLCREVVARDEPFIVDDAMHDPRTKDYAAVRAFPVGAYAGMPLRSADGHVLGSFCVVDPIARKWSEEEIGALADLAAAVQAELRLRAARHETRSHRALMDAHQRIHALMLAGAPRATVLAELVAAVEQQMGGLRAFIALPEAGVCAAARGEGCWEAPIIGTDGVSRGAFVLRSEQPWAPLDQDLALLDQAARLASIVLERDAASRELATAARYFEVSRDLTVTAGFDGHFKSVNPAVEHVLGWSPEEFLSRPFIDMVHPDDRTATLRELSNVAEGEVSFNFLNRYETKDGSYRWLDWNVILSPDEQLMYCGARDVTDRKGVEAALKASERQTRQILETAHDAFVAINAVDRVTDWNQQAEAMFGWSRSEALGRSLSEMIIPVERREAHRRGLQRFVAGGDSRILGDLLEMPAVDRDGREFPVELTISSVETDGSYSFNAFLRDISERKRFEAQLAQARDQALEASIHKSDFLANMSHEIRTPMNGVIGMTGLLLDTELDPEQRRYAEMVHGSGNTLLTIINDILDFSKIEAGKLELEAIDFNLRAVVEEVADLLAERAQGKGLELAVLVESDVPIDACGDAGRLRQTITNLLGNAIKFTERGEVVLRVELAEQSDHDALVRFEVADTGVGVAMERAAMLFEPFSQADASTTRTHGGTGLGLAICKQLTELLGGQIGVQSVPGEGSRFWFTARLAKVADADRRPPAPRDDLSGLRVLIVDDNQTNREILDRQVRAWGMRTGLAEGPEHALDLLRQAAAGGEPYDVALLDMNMPRMDGLELACAIRADDDLPPTLLLLLASAGMRGSSELARQAGISASLTKPVRQSQLYDAIALVTGSGAAQQPELVSTDSVSAAKARPRPRLLLAEDNPVNQQVAVAMLQKLGYRADIVANGAEAVRALSRTSYGAVLMDCQMPEMDGYEATGEIRRTEGRERRTPIIAMTAGAMQGDRERALAAGMDDYISKPVALGRLADALARWVRDDDESHDAPGEEGSRSIDEETLDPGRLAELRSLGQAGMPDILAALVEPFLREAPSQLAALRAAVAAGDGDTLRQQTHALKGSAANLGAPKMATLCAELEVLDPSRDPVLAALAAARLESEFERVRTALRCATSAGAR